MTDPGIESARTAVLPPDRDRRRADRTIIRWASLSAAVSLLILIAVLVVGDGAYEPSPAGLPDPGPVVGWGLPVIRLLADAAGMATIGFILAGAVLLPSRNGELWGLQVRSLRWAAVLAAAWTALILVETVFTAADIIGEPLHSTISGSGLRSFLTQTSFGTSLLVQAVLAATVALCVPWVLSPRVGLLALALALGAFVPQALTGHAAGAGSHDLAIASLLVHVLGVALWIGGLGALCWAATHGSKPLPYAVPRYSTLAGWCFAAVGISGVANAAVRLGSLDNLFGTSYGTLVVAKAVALGILGAFGWRHRRSTVGHFAALRDGARAASTGWPWEDGDEAKAARRERVRRGFLRLASAELTVMLATVALAVGLSRSPTPVTEGAAATPAADLIGFPLPPEPTLARYLFSFTPSGFMLALVGLAGALYAAGVLSLRRRGVWWPVGRTIAWYGGLAIVLYATCGGLGLYAHLLFSAHMTAHMALSMVAPIPLVLGAPLTLAIRTLPGPRVPGDLSPRQVLLRILHSRPVAILSHPVVALGLFIGSLYGFYFTGLFAALMSSHLGHVAMEVHFLAVGLLFFWVLVGVDPQPRRVQPLLKIVVLFATMALHAFFAIALLSSTTPFGESYWAALGRPYSTDLLADQVRGAQISWVLDELPILLVLAAVFRQWVRADEREARRVDRRLDREDRTAAAGGPADGELAAYNAYLAQLDELSRTERAGRHRADIARAERDKTRAERG